MRLTRPAGSLPPWAVMPMLMPYSIAGGYTLVALVFFLSHAGVATAGIAGFATVVMLPQILKFLWAPLIDATLGPKRWYVIGIVATIATLVALAFVEPTQATMPLLTILSVICGFASTLVSLPTEIITAYDVADDRKGQAAGWYQAANVGGGTIGGGLAIFIARQVASPVAPALTLAVLCGLCGLSVLMASSRPPPESAENGITGIRALGADLLALLRSRAGALAVLLVLLPIGTGGMFNLLPALAKDWHADANAVLIVSGLIGGGAQIAGSLLGGFVCDKANRTFVYLAAGLVLSAVSVAMMLGPRTSAAFVGFCLLYNFVMGIAYAAFSAVVLEAIGKGAAATKFTLMICLSNITVQAVQLFDGIWHDSHGIGGMLLGEAALGVAGVAVYCLAAAAGRISKRTSRAAYANI